MTTAPRPINLADVLEAMADAVPDRSPSRPWTATTRSRRSTSARPGWPTTWSSLGVGPGDHVAVHSANRIEWVDAFYGCLKARAVPININYKYLHDELAYLYDNADCVAAIVAPEHVAAVAGARPAHAEAHARARRGVRRRAGRRVDRAARRAAAPTTTTCSTPAARPATPRASSGATRTSSGRRSTPAGSARRSTRSSSWPRRPRPTRARWCCSPAAR